MLYTTKTLLRKHHACAERYKYFFSHHPPIRNDEPIPLVNVLDTNGLDDALWCLRATTAPCDKCARLLAADFAEHVLHLFENKFPGNDRPRRAIETARAFARGEATSEELRAAYGAAHAATNAAYAVTNAARPAAMAARGAASFAASDDAYAATYAASDAASFAARAAAHAAHDAVAEQQWQTKRFRQMLIAHTSET